MREESIVGRKNFEICRRVDDPTADQVAVVWLGDEGLPPALPGQFFILFYSNLLFLALLSIFEGLIVSDHAGRKTKLMDDDPLVDPLCFPLLHLKGTFGWRPGMLYRSLENQEEEVLQS